MKPNWIDSYYEGLEFFYFEPQHMRFSQPASEELQALEQVAKQATKADQVLKHLRKMEVTLNQNIRQFFCIAPNSLFEGLMHAIFGSSQRFNGEFRLYGREVDSELDLRNSTQPDFLFVSDESVVSIEMKIGAKCSLDQVLKYALLGLAVEIKQQGNKHHCLLLLGRGDFTNQFKERFETLEVLKDHATKKELDDFLRNKPSWATAKRGRLREILLGMDVEFWNYERLAEYIRPLRPADSDRSAGAEVYRKLIDGLLEELMLRKLIVATKL
jgi:hypothetical protein